MIHALIETGKQTHTDRVLENIDLTVEKNMASSSIGQLWQQIPGKLKHVSISKNYIWGVNSADHIYMRGFPIVDGSEWKKIDGGLTQLDTNEYEVWGVNARGGIYRRPIDGSGAWQYVGGVLKYVFASGHGWIWGVNKADNI